MEKLFVLAILVFLAAVVVSMIFKSKFGVCLSDSSRNQISERRSDIFGKFEFSSIPIHEMNRIDFDITHPLHDSSRDD